MKVSSTGALHCRARSSMFVDPSTGLDRLNRIALILAGGGGAGEVIDLVNGDAQRLDDIVIEHDQAGVPGEISDVGAGTRGEVVDRNHRISLS